MSVLDCCVRMGMNLGGKSMSAAELKAAELAQKQKAYRLANRELILMQRKVYYEQNADQLRAAKREAYCLSKAAE